MDSHLLNSLKYFKKFRNIRGVNATIVFFFFSKSLCRYCEKLPVTCVLRFSVDKCNNLIKMQILLSQKKTADPNYQQRMPKPLTYRSNSTCNLDNLARDSQRLLLLFLLSFHKSTAVLCRAVPSCSAACPCFCTGPSS